MDNFNYDPQLLRDQFSELLTDYLIRLTSQGELELELTQKIAQEFVSHPQLHLQPNQSQLTPAHLQPDLQLLLKHARLLQLRTAISRLAHQITDRTDLTTLNRSLQQLLDTLSTPAYDEPNPPPVTY